MTKSVDKVLVTGGAGFIGSHTVDLLLEESYQVMILDALVPQVHGTSSRKPSYLNSQARFIQGDVRDRYLLKPIIKEVDAIIHLASSVGVGQSMYQIDEYIDVNTRGTAILLDLLANEDHSIRKFIIASSMSIYGEGKYYCEKCDINRYPELRSEEQLRNKIWASLCPECKNPLEPLPTDEDKPLMPTSIYAMTKRHQEEMCLLIGRTYGIPTTALRYFNVYGPRQALTNPYTGACAIFSSRILNHKPPYIFEDGNQQRDFLHVRDAANANILALEKSTANYQAINIGTGKPTSTRSIADLLIEACGNTKLKPYISQRYRKGDVRHCYADITKARNLLGYESTITLQEGIRELAEWAKAHEWGVVDAFEKALRELEERKLAS